MKLAKIVFYAAGIWGLPVIAIGYFTESYVARKYPPAVNHPEYFYGFMGVALAWQVAFLIIAQDPIRYRPLMLPSMLEKLGYGVALVLLYSLGRINRGVFLFGCQDWIFLAAFIAAYAATRKRTSQQT